jgi:hypothetical protein
MASLLSRFFRRFRRDTPEWQRARLLIEAVDRGGIPTIPGIVHAIARDLHLETDPQESIMTVVDKIRRAIR